MAAFIETFPLAATFNGMPDVADDPRRQLPRRDARVGGSEIDKRAYGSRSWTREPSTDPTWPRSGCSRSCSRPPIEQRVCRSELWPLNQQSGLQIALPFLSQIQPVGTAPLRTAALARWRGMPQFHRYGNGHASRGPENRGTASEGERAGCHWTARRSPEVRAGRFSLRGGGRARSGSRLQGIHRRDRARPDRDGADAIPYVSGDRLPRARTRQHCRRRAAERTSSAIAHEFAATRPWTWMERRSRISASSR